MVAPVLPLLVVSLIACGEVAEQEPAVAVDGASDVPAAVARDTLPREMQQFHMHLRQMEGVDADSMRAMLPLHRQMLSGSMGHMQGMPMMVGTQGTTLMDSLHQDMDTMADVSGMSAEQLEQWMTAHRARALRMMEMHPGMPGRMR